MGKFASVVLILLAAPLAQAADAPPDAPNDAPGGKQAMAGGAEASSPLRWESWRAGNSVVDRASLQRGARNFMNYCNGCHSLKYMRYQRMADDMQIPLNTLSANLVPPGSSPLDYVGTAMPAADAANWFGKTPPDLSLIARSRSPDYLYRFLKTFYADPSRATGSDNLAYPLTAMPAVLSDLEGVKSAVYRDVKSGSGSTEKVFDHFQTISPGNLPPEEFDGFVRDTVNFLDYVGDPAQVERQSMGLWVVLFLLLLTALAMMLKKEYWKDVH